MNDSHKNIPLYGICEWVNYYLCTGINDTASDPVEETLLIHKKSNIDVVVWALGRDGLDYHSDLKGTSLANYNSPICTRIMNSYCPLRKAVKLCRDMKMGLWGRLCMNRNYPPGSAFAQKNPDLFQVNFDGGIDHQRMTYAAEAVRHERMEILLEAQRLGAEALVLDFCRQQPHAAYHPLELAPFIEEFRTDPRNISNYCPEDFMKWFKHRAEHISRFMRELRVAVRKQEFETGRQCLIVPRIPDSSSWLMLAGGMDVETWYAEDLIDGCMLSPFPWCVNDISRHPEYHTAIAERYNKFCIGGIGSLNLIQQKISVPHIKHETFDETPLWLLADRQINAGVSGMSIYQTECVCRMPWLEDIIPNLGNSELCREKIHTPGSRYGIFFTGLDWHARMEYGLNGTSAWRAL